MNNAIIYLLNNSPKDIYFFRKSLTLLRNFYFDQYPCDLICFHEKDFPKEEINLINEYCPVVKFHEIDFLIPNYEKSILDKIPEFVPHPEISSVPGFGMGYRHMCRFFSGEIFKLDCLKNYKYVWRLDTDSLILKKIEYNIFERMAISNSLYGYINIQLDHPKMTIGLKEICQKYFLENNIKPLINLDEENHQNRMFYTNFEIFDMEWFKGQEYMSLYEYIDSSGGIFINRWGDAPIRYIAVNSFIPKEKHLFFEDIKYFHQKEYFNNRIENNFS